MKSPLRAAILLTLSTAGCVTLNTDFVRPENTHLVVGQSTEGDVIAAEGAPVTQRVTTAAARFPDRPGFNWAPGAARHYDNLYYTYAQRGSGPAFIRAAEFLLADGRLCGWDYLSDDPTRSSDFDVPAAQRLLGLGKPSLSELVGVIGPASGTRVYPLTSSATIHQYNWNYLGLDKASGKRVEKTVQVLVGPDDKITTFYISQTDAPLPETRTTVIPIILH